jgi:hypothetical protein
VDLTDALHKASADAPPSTIDIRGLVSSEQRRARSLRRLTVAGSATLSVATIAGLMTLAGVRPMTGPGPAAGSADQAAAASDRPCPTVSPTGPPPQPKPDGPPARPVPETCGVATARLDTALRNALRDAGVVSNERNPFVRTNDRRLVYEATPDVRTPAGWGTLVVRIQPYSGMPPTRQEYGGCAGNPCVFRTAPDGSVVTGFTLPGAQNLINVYHRDRTLVSVVTLYRAGDGTPPTPGSSPPGPRWSPLTTEELITLGRSPALTLYP